MAEDLRAHRERFIRRVRAVILRAFAERMIEEDLTVEQLAERIGVTPRWVRDRLYGSTKLTLDDASYFAHALGYRPLVFVVPAKHVPAIVEGVEMVRAGLLQDEAEQQNESAP